MNAAQTRTFKVARPLSVRSEPNLNAPRVGEGLQPEQIIVVDNDSRTEADGFVWWRHSGGWSAERNTAGDRVFLEAASSQPSMPAAPTTTAAPAPAVSSTAATPISSGTPRRFKVLQTLAIRDAPSLTANRLMDVFLNAGDIVTVEPDTRTESGGFVWWRHDKGWSAERKGDGTAVFLEAVAEGATESQEAPSTAPAAAEPTPAPAVKESSTFRALRRFRVIRELSIRSRPSLSGERLPETLLLGTVLEVDEASRVEVDGFIWWQHDKGWSAEGRVDGSLFFLGDPDSTPAEQGDGTITADGLPQLNGLFSRSPVDLNQVAWVQYFGNTDFAFREGARWNYPVFAQGLHSGLDFGNGVGGSAPAVIPVVAGVNGTFIRSDGFGVAVQSGEYVIIYNHVTNRDSYVKSGAVTPHTTIGILDPGLGSNRHLHLEVRYNREKWIVNPLLLMPVMMRDEIINRWSNFQAHFCSANGFNQWQTPLDQPIIQRGGPVIGPTARR